MGLVDKILSPLACFLTSELANVRKEGKLGEMILKVSALRFCVFIMFYKVWNTPDASIFI